MKEVVLSDSTIVFVTDNSTPECLCCIYSNLDAFFLEFKKLTNENLTNMSFDGQTDELERTVSDVSIIGGPNSTELEVHYILQETSVNAQANEIRALKAQIAELQDENVRYRDGYEAYNVLSAGL